MPPFFTPTTIACYLLFLALSLAALTFAARTLHRAGRTVLLRAFPADEPLALAAGELVTLAFVLTNLGLIACLLLPRFPLNTPDQLVQFETDKCGAVLLSLGLTAFIATFALARMRKTPAADSAGRS